MRNTLTLLLFLFSLLANAQETQRCQVTHYNTNNGLAGPVINSITSDAHGFIWMVSENHLQYFDGNSFHILPLGRGIHEIPGKVFNSVYCSPEKEIWIFYIGGFSVYQSTTHSFWHSPEVEPFKNQQIKHITNYQGDIVVSAGEKIFFINRITKKSRLIPGLIPSEVYESSHSVSGTIFKNRNGLIYYSTVSNPQLQVPTISDENKRLLPVEAGEDKFLLFGEEAVAIVDTKTRQVQKKVIYPVSLTQSAIKMPQSVIPGKTKTTLWVTLDGQVWEFDMLKQAFTKTLANLDGTPLIKNGYCKKLYLDNNNNLWISTNLKGLLRVNLNPNQFKLYAAPQDENNFVKCFLINKLENRVICGTYGNGILIYDSTGTLLKKIALKKTDIVTSIVQADNGCCIVLLYGYNNPFLLNYHTYNFNKLALNDRNNWLFSSPYYSEIVPLGNNEYYYETSGYPVLLSLKNNILSIDSIPTSRQLKMPEHRLILARSFSLNRFYGENFMQTSLRKLMVDELGINCVFAAGDSIIFGTAKGVFLFNSQGAYLGSYGVQHGLRDEYIYATLVDEKGNIWCSHNLGLSRISINGAIQNYVKEDGLQDNEFNMGAAFAASDGELFFGGTNGLNSFYPKQQSGNRQKPKLLITKIGVNEKDLYGDTAYWSIQKLKLPLSQNRVKLTLTALGNIPSSAYQFYYRVKEEGKSWNKLNSLNEINLALPPGTYHIEAAAMEKSNPFPNSQLEFTIIIKNPFYYEWWFYAAGLVLALLLAWLLFKWFNHRKFKQKMQMQDNLLQERHRISRDLHDNIGAYTTALLANADKLEYNSNKTDVAELIRKNAKQILSNLRNTIWILNNQHLSVLQLHENFKNYCFKILQNFENISLEIEEHIETDARISPDDALHLNNLLQEIIQNVVKHSHAGKIKYEISCKDELLIHIKDDGTGFDPKTAAEGYGLKNMYWRAEQANAVIKVNSRPGHGTSISIAKKCS